MSDELIWKENDRELFFFSGFVGVQLGELRPHQKHDEPGAGKYFFLAVKLGGPKSYGEPVWSIRLSRVSSRNQQSGIKVNTVVHL